ncbi:MAG: DegV family protein [Bacilli bacterium]|nr:DegV family protein [Bacilli bacterium]
MANYVLSCCTTADLTKEKFQELGVEYCVFHFNVDGVDYPDDLGQSYPFPKFYDDMAKGAMTKTSQVSVGEYTEYFEKFLAQGKDIVHCALSGGLSGTVQSANIAADILREKYPGRQIYIIDSLAASSGFGLLMAMLAKKRDEGASIEDIVNYAEEIKLNVNHWFFSTDLTFYVRGGRVSKASGFIGNMLHICPLLNVDYEGHLIPREKIRSEKKVQKIIVDRMIENADNGTNYDGICYISHSNCEEYAQGVVKHIEANFPNLVGKVEVFSIGTTIGAHTGPGTVALFFMGKKREN